MIPKRIWVFGGLILDSLFSEVLTILLVVSGLVTIIVLFLLLLLIIIRKPFCMSSKKSDSDPSDSDESTND